MNLVPSDLTTASRWAAREFERLPPTRWDAISSDIEWTVRRTVDHLADTMLLYSAYVARRARDRVFPPRNGDASASNPELINAFESGAAVLERLLGDFGAHERAFHPSGLADLTGWIGLACTEIIVHTSDACGRNTGAIPHEIDVIAGATVDRVLPWTPLDGSGVERLLWATGRAFLGELPPEPSDWWWHSAPLSEWARSPHRRSAPPEW